MPYYGYSLLYGTNGVLLIAIVVVFVLGLVAQAGVMSAFNKYNRVRASSGVTASDVARDLLYSGGADVKVTCVKGALTDHFNPQTHTVGLSEAVYGRDSVAALAVAAHEIGHVMQYQEGYGPIKLRNAVLPAAQFASNAAPFIVLIGILLSSSVLAEIGVYIYGAMLLFQVVTLPVEFNASRRAITMLTDGGYISRDEQAPAKKVLRSAALTYVVAAFASLLTLLRLASIASRARRN